MTTFKIRPKFTKGFNSLTTFWKEKNRQVMKLLDHEANKLKNKTQLMKIEFNRNRQTYLQICSTQLQSKMTLSSLTMNIQTKSKTLKTSLISFQLRNTINFIKWQNNSQYLMQLERILTWWLKSNMETTRILFNKKSDLILKLNSVFNSLIYKILTP